jgi:hypothetical protein
MLLTIALTFPQQKKCHSEPESVEAEEPRISFLLLLVLDPFFST